MLRQQLLNALSLKAFASPVDQPHLAETLFSGSFEIGIHDGQNVSRLKSMQVDGVLDLEDGDVVVVVVHRTMLTPWSLRAYRVGLPLDVVAGRRTVRPAVAFQSLPLSGRATRSNSMRSLSTIALLSLVACLVACGPARPPVTASDGVAAGPSADDGANVSDPWAITGELEREQLPAQVPKLDVRAGRYPRTPKGLPLPPARCADFQTRSVKAAACGDRTSALGSLDAALAMSDPKARDEGLQALERCDQFPKGVITALRADVAPVACADTIVEHLATLDAPDMSGVVHDALCGLGIAGMLSRASTEAPTMSPPYTKDTVKAFIKTKMSAWAEQHAVALQDLMRHGSGLRYYGRAVVGVEAGLADIRYVEAMRAVPLPQEFVDDQELKDAYLDALETSLEPRKRRGRDAALVGLGGLGSIGVIRDERVDRARELLSKMFGGSRIDALDVLLLPPLAPAQPANAEQRLASRLQTFYASLVFPPEVARDDAMLRQLIENGVSLPHRIALAKHQPSLVSRLYYARARFELGQNYWRSVDFAESVRLLHEWPASEDKSPEARLLLALGIAIRGGPSNAAEMMDRASANRLGIGNVAALDAMVAEGDHLVGATAFNAALLAQLAAPAQAGSAYWRDVADRFRRAAAVIADLPTKRDAQARAQEADLTARAIEQRSN